MSPIKENKIKLVKLGRPCDVEDREQVDYPENKMVTERWVKEIQKTLRRSSKNFGAKNELE